MGRILKNYVPELTGILVLGLIFYFVTSGVPLLAPLTDITRGWSDNLSSDLHNFTTIFLSLFIEGLPFILFGTLLSSFVHVYVKEDTLWRFLPKHPVLAIPLAACFGLILPICECGIVPVARRLVQKGLPSYIAFTFLLAVPIVNPITIASTYMAFGDSWEMVWMRTGVGAGIAMVMGILFYLFFRDKPVLKEETEAKRETACCDGSHDHDHDHGHEHGGTCTHHSHGEESRMMHALSHSVFEFIDMGKYFCLGAFISAGFQTFVGVAAIKQFAQYEGIALILMMALAFCLSICSSADAFLAASFRSVLGQGTLLGFLVYGPMVDMKNVLMMAGGFKRSVVLFFVGGTTLVTLLTIWIFF
ncbi:permease [Laceyella putida]|uniref:Permease n=2 Tax=Laceyella putida TaxID=110101 RepID=A0ABW2RG66_9BACL